MAIVTFWSNGKEQSGKTLSIAAVATLMAIEHNYRILVISTEYKDDVLNNCFWEPKKPRKNFGIFGPNTNIAMADGIEGLAKIIKSNKLSPENITNYTKIIFKERLEILQSFKGEKSEYLENSKMYPDIINLANSYYDLIFVDLNMELDEDTKQTILANSNLVIVNLSQRLSSINKFMELRQENLMLNSKKVLLLVGRYDKFSKYTIKNLTRYMNEKNKILTIPYNTLFFEACEEAKVPDLFLKLRKMDEDDRNGFFLSEVSRVSENIEYKLQELQMKL